MALIACRECKKQISSNTKSCPYCGNPMRKSNGCAFVMACLVVIAFIPLCSSIFSPVDDGKTPEQRVNAKKAEDAWYKGKHAIEKALKSPSTAKFSSPGWDSNTGWNMDDNGSVHAFGYVDAQNGFGAMIRSSWRVDFDSAGRLTDAKLGDQVLYP